MKTLQPWSRLLIALSLLSLTACNRNIIDNGVLYTKVARKDYVQAQAVDSLKYTIQHYRVVNNQ